MSYDDDITIETLSNFYGGDESAHSCTMANVLKSLPHKFYVVDYNTRKIILTNDSNNNSNLNSTSLETTSAIGKLLQRELLDGEGTLFQRNPIELAHETGERIISERMCVDDEGQQTAFEFQVFPFKDTDGVVRNIIIHVIDISERHRVDRSIRRANKLYRTIIDHVPNGSVHIFDTDLRFFIADGPLLRQLGKESSELIGGNLRDMFGNVGVDEIESKMHDALHGSSSIFEFVIDDHRYVASLNPAMLDLGSTNLGIAIFQDITEWRRAELNMEEERFLLREVLEAIPAPVYYKNQNGRYLGCNSAFAWKVLGVPKSQVIGRTINDFRDRLRGKGFLDYVEQERTLMLSPGVSSAEINVVYSDSDKRSITEHRSTFKSRNGDVAGLVGVMIDNTFGRAIDKKRKLAEGRMLAVSNSIKDIVWSKDKIGIYIFVNEAFLQFFKLSENQVIGFSDTDLWPKHLAKRYEANDNNIILAKTAQSIKEQYIIADKDYWLDVYKTPLLDENGEVVEIVNVARHSFTGQDVTIQNAKESAHDVNDNEKNSVQQDIQNKENDILQMYWTALGRLSSGIAHELGSPAQYLIDNMSFIKTASSDLCCLVKKLEKLKSEKPNNVCSLDIRKEFDAVDWEYIIAEIPQAIDEAQYGLNRIVDIAKALRVCSAINRKGEQNIDINQVVANTVAITKNEWKYSSDVKLDLDFGLPLVCCYAQEIHYIVLMLILKAVHVASCSGGNSGNKKAKIFVRTQITSEDITTGKLTAEESNLGGGGFRKSYVELCITSPHKPSHDVSLSEDEQRVIHYIAATCCDSSIAVNSCDGMVSYRVRFSVY